MKDYKGISSFDELIEKEYGKIGTESRNDYEEKAQMFIVSEMLKEARRQANMTQEQLAEKADSMMLLSSKQYNRSVGLIHKWNCEPRGICGTVFR